MAAIKFKKCSQPQCYFKSVDIWETLVFVSVFKRITIYH